MSLIRGSRLVPAMNLSFFVALAGWSAMAASQSPVSDACVERIPVVQSDGTARIDISSYMASGVSSAPMDSMSGNLDSCTWRVDSRNSSGDAVTVNFEEMSTDAFLALGEMTPGKLSQNDTSGGLYYYQADNNQTVIWIKPRMNIFSPGSLTARLNVTETPLVDLVFNQTLFFYRRNNTQFQPVKLDFDYQIGDEYNVSASAPAFPETFSTSVVSKKSMLESRCYRITIDKALLQSGSFLYLTWSVDDATGGGTGVRDDIGFAPYDVAGTNGQNCTGFTVSEVTPTPTASESTMVSTSAKISTSAGAASSSVTPSITVDATCPPTSGSASELAANIRLGLGMFAVAFGLINY